MTVQKDPKDGTAHIRGCYVWRIMRIIFDMPRAGNDNVKAEYKHPYEKYTTAAMYARC